MKGIVSLQREGEPGKYHEVGMSHRTIVQAKKDKRLMKLAEEWAKGKPFRLELFPDDSIYGDPLRVLYGNNGTPTSQAA